MPGIWYRCATWCDRWFTRCSPVAEHEPNVAEAAPGHENNEDASEPDASGVESDDEIHSEMAEPKEEIDETRASSNKTFPDPTSY